jgi:hypothetical protein
MPVWNEISEYDYMQALEVLPPAFQRGEAFLVGEPTDHCAEGPRFAAYIAKDGAFWTLSEPVTRANIAKIVSGKLVYEFSDTPLPDIKIRALAAHFKVSTDEINEERGDYFTVDSEPGEYAVLTDEEANERWEEYLDSYIDDCILEGKDGALAKYFDRDAWKDDARHDGRGHCLSPYDGEEHEIKIDGEWIYIYRTN